MHVSDTLYRHREQREQWDYFLYYALIFNTLEVNQDPTVFDMCSNVVVYYSFMCASVFISVCAVHVCASVHVCVREVCVCVCERERCVCV